MSGFSLVIYARKKAVRFLLFKAGIEPAIRLLKQALMK
jgi:hypothetical protein